MIARNPEYWINRLELAPHPEGGYYRQSYRSALILESDGLPVAFAGARPSSTAIYFLLQGEDFYAFHRLRSDEMWHFYCGSPLVVEVIDPRGQLSHLHLGSDAEAGETFQGVVEAGCWFASHLLEGGSFALVGCTVSPGFDFADFEMAKRSQLETLYPEHRQLIRQFTRV
jgi:predicted cupin superfamily sugar epimerase